MIPRKDFFQNTANQIIKLKRKEAYLKANIIELNGFCTFSYSKNGQKIKKKRSFPSTTLKMDWRESRHLFFKRKPLREEAMPIITFLESLKSKFTKFLYPSFLKFLM